MSMIMLDCFLQSISKNMIKFQQTLKKWSFRECYGKISLKGKCFQYFKRGEIKMKKALLLCPMLALVALAGMPGTVSADSLPISSDWVVTSNGAEPTSVYKTENGYMMNHVNDYGETGYFDKHILLDS